MAYIISSGESSNGIILNYDSMTVLNGGIATDTTVNDDGRLNVSSGGTAANATVSSGGYLYVYSGGTANSTTVNSGGELNVYPGGTATNIVWTPCEGHVYVSDGGYATFVSEYSGVYFGSGNKLLSNTAVMDGKTLDNGCDMYVMNGGTANSTTVNSSGYLYVSSGGTADNTTVNNGGTLDVHGTANNTTVNANGRLTVQKGGILNNLIIYSNGRMDINSGGIANNSLIGRRMVTRGDMNNTTLYSGGALSCGIGRLKDITVFAGADLALGNECIITGQLTILEGAHVSAYGGIIDFDISNCLPQKAALINNFSRLTAKNTKYTLTVSETQARGDYTLAEYVNLFDFTISMQNTLGGELGDLTINKSLVIGEITYTLCLDDSLTLTLNVEAPDTTAPTVSNIQASTTELTNQDVVLTADFADDVELASSLYKLGETGEWSEYGNGVTVTTNTTVYFKAVDAAGNESEVAVYEVTNIDKTPPEKPVATADVTEPTNMDVLVTATFSEDSVVKQYSFDCENWGTYPGGVLVGTNLSVYFRGIDAAGNVSESAEYEVTNVDRSAPVITLTGDNQTPATEALLTAETDDGSALYYCVDDSGWKQYTETLTVTANGSYSFRATDAAGNTAISEILFANIIITAPVNLVGTANGVSWEYPAGADLYVVNLSTDDFEHVFRWLTDTTAQDLYELPGGTYQWRVMVFDDGEDWAVGEDFVSENDPGTAKVVQSNADGVDDIFFASANGTWSREYFAQHAGSLDEEGWTGTGEFVSANGKGRIQNLFFGSSDPSILCLTDGENGDAIFLDDVYTELPEELEANTARLLRIREIWAGAGDDIIDMTSQRFEYVGGGQTLCGGDGNDVIWANKGANWLFGDAGDDRITGASGNDVITGGIGDDRLHGGGGDDVFTFCENFGSDTVKQLGTGTVTLWFASGSNDNWNEETLTYSDGTNSVKVSGVAAEQVTLKFGAGATPDDEDQFASLSSMGAFEAFTTRKIFEEATLA